LADAHRGSFKVDSKSAVSLETAVEKINQQTTGFADQGVLLEEPPDFPVRSRRASTGHEGGQLIQ
jgi:hypothetical protein